MWWWTGSWILIGVAALILEAVALANSTPGDTLSEHLWIWMGIRRKPGSPQSTYRPKPKAWLRFTRFAFAAGWLWFGFHILSGGFM